MTSPQGQEGRKGPQETEELRQAETEARMEQEGGLKRKDMDPGTTFTTDGD